MADLEKYKLSSLYWESDKNEEAFFVYSEHAPIRKSGLWALGFFSNSELTD